MTDVSYHPDPFRNIVGVGWPDRYVVVEVPISGSRTQGIGEECSPPDDPFEGDYASSIWLKTVQHLLGTPSAVFLSRNNTVKGIEDDYEITGVPSSPVGEFSFGEWEYFGGGLLGDPFFIGVIHAMVPNIEGGSDTATNPEWPLYFGLTFYAEDDSDGGNLTATFYTESAPMGDPFCALNNAVNAEIFVTHPQPIVATSVPDFSGVSVAITPEDSDAVTKHYDAVGIAVPNGGSVFILCARREESA